MHTALWTMEVYWSNNRQFYFLLEIGVIGPWTAFLSTVFIERLSDPCFKFPPIWDLHKILLDGNAHNNISRHFGDLKLLSMDC